MIVIFKMTLLNILLDGIPGVPVGPMRVIEMSVYETGCLSCSACYANNHSEFSVHFNHLTQTIWHVENIVQCH
jgi:hypothetical protein